MFTTALINTVDSPLGEDPMYDGSIVVHLNARPLVSDPIVCFCQTRILDVIGFIAAS